MDSFKIASLLLPDRYKKTILSVNMPTNMAVNKNVELIATGKHAQTSAKLSEHVVTETSEITALALAR